MFNPYYDTKVNNKTPGASFYELGLFEFSTEHLCRFIQLKEYKNFRIPRRRNYVQVPHRIRHCSYGLKE
jgi:hypothetical protein